MFSKQLLFSGNMKLENLACLALIDRLAPSPMRQWWGSPPRAVPGSGRKNKCKLGPNYSLECWAGEKRTAASLDVKSPEQKWFPYHPFCYGGTKRKPKYKKESMYVGFDFVVCLRALMKASWSELGKSGKASRRSRSQVGRRKAICEVAWQGCPAERHKAWGQPFFFLGPGQITEIP